MRLTLLALPSVLIAGCVADADRTTSTTPPAVPNPVSSVPAAPSASAAAAAVRPAPKPVTVDLAKFVGPTEAAANFGFDEGAGRLFLLSNGAIELPLKLAADGNYEIVINAACDEGNGQKAKFSVTLDGKVINSEITCTVVEAKEYTVKAPGLKSGDHKIAIAFLNDMYKENEYDINLYVHGITLRPAQ
jgi:hypothetical protein